MLTLADVTNMISAVLGGSAAVRPASAIANDAGQWLVSQHPWTFLRRPPTWLAFVENQDWCALPSDFARLIGLEPDNDIRLEFITPDLFAEYVRNDYDPGAYYLGVFVAYTDIAGVVAPRVMLYPTPEAADPNGLLLTYEAGWRSLSQPSDRVALPDWMEGLYIETVAAWARGVEEDDVASVSLRLAPVRNGPTFAAAVKRDTQTAMVFGELAPVERGPRVGHFERNRIVH